MLYFAYGSNMSQNRLEERVGKVFRVSKAVLKGHDLRFHKISKDGSGKADAFLTGIDIDHIWGVLYKIEKSQKPQLDVFEGFDKGYDIKEVVVETKNSERFNAFTYTATAIDHSLVAYDWYLRHVLRGATEAGLPLDYIECLSAIKTRPDSNSERKACELSIYL